MGVWLANHLPRHLRISQSSCASSSYPIIMRAIFQQCAAPKSKIPGGTLSKSSLFVWVDMQLYHAWRKKELYNQTSSVDHKQKSPPLSGLRPHPSGLCATASGSTKKKKGSLLPNTVLLDDLQDERAWELSSGAPVLRNKDALRYLSTTLIS